MVDKEFAYGLFNTQIVVGELDNYGKLHYGNSMYALNVLKYEKPLHKGEQVPVKFRYGMERDVKDGFLLISYGKARVVDVNGDFYKTQDCIISEA